MSNNHSDYRPRSPDLAPFVQGAFKPPPLPPLTGTTSYQYQQQEYSSATRPGLAQHRGSYDASPYFSPQSQYPIGGAYFPPVPPPTQLPVPTLIAQDPVPIKGEYPSTLDGAFGDAPHIKMPRRKQPKREEDDWTPEGDMALTNNGGSAPNGMGPSLGIDVKTKFPVARIKRIMQADEEVGKVAQATPTAVSKALELFMINLVTKAATEAKERGSKKVTAAHLKQAVGRDEKYDFLSDIVEKVPDPTSGGHAAKEGSPDSGDGGPPKKKRPNARKKKSESDD